MGCCALLLVGLAGCGGAETELPGDPGSADTGDTTPPSAPTALIASAVSPSEVSLSWTAATDNIGIAGYRIYRDGTLDAILGNVTSHQDTGLSASTTYSYTIQAVDIAGNRSGQSAAASATTPSIPDTTAPSTPTGLTASAVSPSQINLGWTTSTDNVSVAGYRVYRDGALITTVSNVTSYQNTGLSSSTTYSYTVQALDAASNASALSAQASATTQAGSGDPGAVTFLCTFGNSPTDCGFGEQAKVAGRASIVSIGRDGATAVRLHTEPGDNNVAGSGDAERNDLSTSQANTDGYQGREHWWAHSVLFPSDYVDPPESTTSTWNWQVVFDFHATGNVPGTVANFQVEAMPTTAISPDRPTGLRFRGYGGDPAGEFTAPIGPVERNVWYDFVYHVKWSSGSDGFFDAWVNGKKVLTYRGPTLYPGQGVYLKLANYHTPYGQPNSVIHDRVLRGTTALSVSAGPLEGVLELVNGVLTPVLQ